MTDSPTSSPLRGALAMIASSLVMSGMAVLIKLAGTEYQAGTYELAFFRFAVGVVVLASVALVGKIELRFVNHKLLLLRGMLGTVGVVCYYYAIAHLGVARGTVISYAYIVFAAIGGVVFLHEHLRWQGWVAIAGAMFGLALTTDTKAIISGASSADLIAIFGAVAAAGAVITVRGLRKTDSPFAIFMSQCAIGFWVVLIPATAGERVSGAMGGVILMLIGLTAAVGQLLMTYAYRHTTVATGSLLSLLTPMLSIPLGVFFFHEVMTLREGIGMGLVIAAGAYMTLSPQKDIPPNGQPRPL